VTLTVLTQPEEEEAQPNSWSCHPGQKWTQNSRPLCAKELTDVSFYFIPVLIAHALQEVHTPLLSQSPTNAVSQQAQKF